MHRIATVIALAVACVAAGCAHSASPSPTRAAASLPTQAAAELARLNAWCSGHDDCDVSERPDAHPGRVAHGETNGFIHASRERLAALGAVAVWNPGQSRFELAAAPERPSAP